MYDLSAVVWIHFLFFFQAKYFKPFLLANYIDKYLLSAENSVMRYEKVYNFKLK